MPDWQFTTNGAKKTRNVRKSGEEGLKITEETEEIKEIKIYLPILAIIQNTGPITTKGLTLRANLSYGVVSEKLRDLCKLGLVSADTDSGFKNYWANTDRGIKLLALFTDTDKEGNSL
jgi:predicted transcriptional regulator